MGQEHGGTVLEHGFAEYRFPYEENDDQRVRAAWGQGSQESMLERLLAFAKRHNLQAGWHWGLVLGPSRCPEWCAAQPKWVPQRHYPRAYPVCRVFFLARTGMFEAEPLGRRLRLPLEDERERHSFERRFGRNFWRVRMAAWKGGYDEIALTLRSRPELERALAVMGEALKGLR